MAVLDFYGAKVEYDNSREYGIFVLDDEDPAPAYMMLANVERFLTTPWPPTAPLDVNKQIESMHATKRNNLTGIAAARNHGVLGDELEQIAAGKVQEKIDAVENTNRVIDNVIQAIAPFLN